jgi:hypothetical protein
MAGCGGADDAPDAPPPGIPADSTTEAGPTDAGHADRPDGRTDTVSIEGMAEPVELTLFRSPEGFPLPFTAYVPTNMRPEIEDGGARFIAAFGGVANPDAFVHVFVFPAGTDRAHALDAARAYETGRGVPVSRGLEPVEDGGEAPRPAWAIEAYRFRYQGVDGWFVGTIGVGEHGGRYFQIVRHYPAEYGDGFPPRADLVLETWRWADGTGLGAGSG